MKNFIFLSVALLSAGSLTAQSAPAAKSSTAKTAKPAALAGPVTLPAGAVKVDTYTWKYTDATGKKWVYRQTGFGLQKAPEKTSEVTLPDYKPQIAVREDGENLVFEKQTGFGVQRWSRKRTELNELEQQAWEDAKKLANAKAGVAK